jgi:hypothetical protein
MSWRRHLLFAVVLSLSPHLAWALGPNLLVNGGVEGGDHCYWHADVAPFSIVNDPPDAHGGVMALKVAIQPSGSCHLSLPLFVWPNTAYTTSVWYKGNGTLQLTTASGDLSVKLAHVNFTANSSWRQAHISYKTRDGMFGLQIEINEVGGPGTTVYLDDLATALTDGQTMAFDPVHPVDNPGFKLLFSDDFHDDHTIDVKNTQAGGYHWYLHQFFHKPDTTPRMFCVAGGVLTLLDCPVPFSDTLHSAAPAKNRDGFVGTVFRADSPMYFEGRFRIRHFDKTGTTKGDPAFWTQDLSMGTNIDQDMPGHPGHHEMIENDFVELNHSWAGPHISGLGDWDDHRSLGDGCNQYPPPGTDYGQYHTYGCLLVPGTPASHHIGYRTIYFAGVPMVSNCWIDGQLYHGIIPETRESMGSYRFSRIEHACEVLILGTGQGGVSPMDFQYVRVYGTSDSDMKVVR